MNSGDDEDRPPSVDAARELNEDDFAAPHFELDDEAMATGLNEANGAQNANVTLIRVFVVDPQLGAAGNQCFLTLRCLPGASVQHIKLQAIAKLKQRYASGDFDPNSYVLSTVASPALPQKRLQSGGAKGVPGTGGSESSDRDLHLPEYVPFMEYFDQALVSEQQGHKVVFMRLERRDKKQPVQPIKSAERTQPGTTPAFRLVRVGFREGESGNPNHGFITLKCTEETTARQIKTLAINKYNAKRGETRTSPHHSRNSLVETEDDGEADSYNMTIGMPTPNQRRDSKSFSFSGSTRAKTGAIRDDERMWNLYPPAKSPTGTAPQVLEILLHKQQRENSMSRSLHRDDSVKGASVHREDSIKRPSVSHSADDPLMRYVFAADAPLEEPGDADQGEFGESAAADSILLRVKLQASGGLAEGFVTLKCEETMTLHAVKEQALNKFLRRDNNSALPEKLHADMFCLWRIDQNSTISDEGVEGRDATFWDVFQIQASTSPIEVQMVLRETRDEEEPSRSGVETFEESKSGQVFIQHGITEKDRQIQVWYSIHGGGCLCWNRGHGLETVALSDITEVYLGSYWFPELFTGCQHARRCLTIEWAVENKSDARNSQNTVGWLHLESSSSDALRPWVEELSRILMRSKMDEQVGEFHQQCTVYHPVVKPK